MFAKLARSWQFARISYGIIWDFKRLLIFPVLSTLACVAVLASFAAPLWLTGTLETWGQAIEAETQIPVADQVVMYSLLFAFYFCCYLVIVFFNTALTACALKVVGGEQPAIGEGLSVAWRRLPPILGWALVSALVGVLLQMIESANEKAGRLVAALVGGAWTALTYFVVPVLVIEGTGPVASIKRSTAILRETWGEAVGGQFSLGIFSALITLPLVALIAVLGFTAAHGSILVIAITVAAALALVLAASAVTSAAGVVMKALIYNFATGRTIPENLDRELVAQAFRPRG